MKSEINALTSENEKMSRAKAPAPKGDIAKKLKKRELECAALWDTLKDLNNTEGPVYDKGQLPGLLAV
jgi:predicted AAA+ superfamily ATPase